MMMNELANLLTAMYKLGIWPEDPKSKEGKARFKYALKVFRGLLDHEWIKTSLKRKRKIRILEICGGTGIGGVGLAKALQEKGSEVELYVTDLREDALKIAKSWGTEELNTTVKTFKINAREVHSLKIRADIALLYGFSAPHFDPWDMIKVIASVCESLVDDGVFVIQESDRRWSIFYRAGYKDFLPERIDDEKVLVSIHAGYDFKRGVFKRAMMDLAKKTSPIITDAYFWGLAELMALLWIFFKDVDFMQDETGRISGMIIGAYPRRLISINDLKEMPKILREQ